MKKGQILSMVVLVAAALGGPAWGALVGTYVMVAPYNGSSGNTFDANSAGSQSFWSADDLQDVWLFGTGVSWIGSGFNNYLRSEAAWEDCPELVTLVTGLDAAKSYDLYVVYRSTRHTMGILAGLQKDTLTAYTMDNGTLVSDTDTYQVKVGRVSGVTQASVYVDDYNPQGNDQANFYYGVEYAEVPTVTLQGKVVLQGYVGDNTSVGVKFVLTPSSGGASIPRFVNLAADGGFQITNLLEDNYTVAVKAYASLGAVLHDVQVTGLTTTLADPIVLTGDDINGDNRVSFEDFSILQNSYGDTSDAGASPLAAATGGCALPGVLLMIAFSLAGYRLGLRTE